MLSKIAAFVDEGADAQWNLRRMTQRRKLKRFILQASLSNPKSSFEFQETEILGMK